MEKHENLKLLKQRSQNKQAGNICMSLLLLMLLTVAEQQSE